MTFFCWFHVSWRAAGRFIGNCKPLRGERCRWAPWNLWLPLRCGHEVQGSCDVAFINLRQRLCCTLASILICSWSFGWVSRSIFFGVLIGGGLLRHAKLLLVEELDGWEQVIQEDELLQVHEVLHHRALTRVLAMWMVLVLARLRFGSAGGFFRCSMISIYSMIYIAIWTTSIFY